IEFLAIREGEFGRLDLQMDKLGAGRVETVELEALKQRELLKKHRSLRPDAGLLYRVAPVVVRERLLDGCFPRRHVLSGQNAAMFFAGNIHHFLRAAEFVDRLRNETLRPDFARLFDLRDAIAAGAFGLLEDALVGVG